MKLKDKVCIVTGATSGMGKAIAETFSSEGAKLVLSGQNRERGQNLEKQLGNSVFLAGDVTDPIYNQNLVQLAMDTFGQLDILSLNAGILGLGNVEELSIASWHKTIDTNLSSIFYLCKYGLPYLQKGSNSNILINASIAAFKSFPNHPAYCASKAGAIALMKQMAMEYAPKIRVNAICPGPVDTPLLWESAKAFENPEKAVANAEKATLLKRLGTPEDIAKLALFMVSDDSSWITGTTITIDGGIINT
ncbi:SDR family oxidoreductase [Allomuricauda taeanensis]|uniref:SDR family NAD(P)-dependent oxidoreductase n=1 Tax=Flagellimonas taeanensis TaxID=1005926 RepID=UPI002E7B5ECD|nr:SDR family oxidoreductase [Allomuricauda taeanensis]MEE1961223.1 SDR family oxidoreductase [Allomuricauda taeanensis]